MSGQEICSIIETSAKANVRLIELPGLRLEFNAGEPASAPTATQTAEPPSSTGTAQPAEHEEADLRLAEAMHKEDRAALMLIENPAEYERLRAAGEFDDVYDGANDEDFDE